MYNKPFPVFMISHSFSSSLISLYASNLGKLLFPETGCLDLPLPELFMPWRTTLYMQSALRVSSPHILLNPCLTFNVLLCILCFSLLKSHSFSKVGACMYVSYSSYCPHGIFFLKERRQDLFTLSSNKGKSPSHPTQVFSKSCLT